MIRTKRAPTLIVSFYVERPVYLDVRCNTHLVNEKVASQLSFVYGIISVKHVFLSPVKVGPRPGGVPPVVEDAVPSCVRVGATHDT